MDTLPDDVARVVEELLGAKEIGALGCASKRWRPNEKTWERVAKRDPLKWGLTLHHEDLVFYPLDQAWLMSSPLDEDQVGLTSSPLSSRPSIVVRIVRDAAGAAVDLVIEEFNWEDRSPRFAQIRMNFL